MGGRRMPGILPDGFTSYTDGLTLQLEGRSIAHMVLLEVGGKVRVTVGHWGARPGNHVFLNTQEGAKRYIETWATKWESEIRRAVPGRMSRGCETMEPFRPDLERSPPIPGSGVAHVGRAFPDSLCRADGRGDLDGPSSVDEPKRGFANQALNRVGSVSIPRLSC